MKYLVLVLTLGCATFLLTGCPDSKLPTPSPSVPTPKANTAAHQPVLAGFAMNQPLVAMPLTKSRS